MASVLQIHVGDVLELRKKHPCGHASFKVIRLGSEVKILCLGCGHDMTLDRIKLERAVKKVVSQETTE